MEFRDWLAGAIQESGLSKREIARRMAAKHPAGANTDTMETARRTINKILKGDLSPRDPLRDSIAEALDRDDHPSVEEEGADDLEATLTALTRENPVLARALVRMVRRR